MGIIFGALAIAFFIYLTAIFLELLFGMDQNSEDIIDHQ